MEISASGQYSAKGRSFVLDNVAASNAGNYDVVVANAYQGFLR